METVKRTPEEITITNMTSDKCEEEAVTEFMASECGCQRKCLDAFSKEYVASQRASCAELSRSELDMALLGQMMACIDNSSKVSTEGRHTDVDRKKMYSAYTHRGKQVCLKTFKFLHGIGDSRLKNLTKALQENGLTPRVHGNISRKPKHALSFESIEHVVHFLYMYAEQHAILLPGRVPGYSRSDVQLLPSSQSKRTIWRAYHLAAEGNSAVHAVAYSMFCYLWRTLVPSILVMKPRSDLCWQCQQYSAAIVRSCNSTEAEKTSTISEALEHLRIVKLERSKYKAVCEECKQSVQAHFGHRISLPHSEIPANSNEISVHYSFDYAQQVHYPSDPLQPGPIYFLTPRKCTIFGVSCEALPRQINFLTDEAGDCGKGANAVISRLHFFFEVHGL